MTDITLQIVLKELITQSICKLVSSIYSNFQPERCIAPLPPQLLPVQATVSCITSSSIISVILPTYNEESTLLSTIESIVRDSDKNVEIIVADGGSTDHTLSRCREKFPNVTIIPTCGDCRSRCQNRGAEKARGDILLFLHADSILPERWSMDVRQTMACVKNTIGCFSFHPIISDNVRGLHYLWGRLCLAVISFSANLRSRLAHLPFGDQALFFRRSFFIDGLGGFPDVPFLEDLDLVKLVRDKKLGRIMTLPSAVQSSARRWEKNGFLYTTFLNQLIIWGRSVGVSHTRLAQWYYGLSKKRSY